eukprot:295699-Chlamydomonas_euryale.AAC.3
MQRALRNVHERARHLGRPQRQRPAPRQRARQRRAPRAQQLRQHIGNRVVRCAPHHRIDRVEVWHGRRQRARRRCSSLRTSSRRAGASATEAAASAANCGAACMRHCVRAAAGGKLAAQWRVARGTHRRRRAACRRADVAHGQNRRRRHVSDALQGMHRSLALEHARRCAVCCARAACAADLAVYPCMPPACSGGDHRRAATNRRHKAGQHVRQLGATAAAVAAGAPAANVAAAPAATAAAAAVANAANAATAAARAARATRGGVAHRVAAAATARRRRRLDADAQQRMRAWRRHPADARRPPQGARHRRCSGPKRCRAAAPRAGCRAA